MITAQRMLNNLLSFIRRAKNKSVPIPEPPAESKKDIDMFKLVL
jgi:hypothetical protein